MDQQEPQSGAVPDQNAPEATPGEQPDAARRIGRRGLVISALAAPTVMTLGAAGSAVISSPAFASGGKGASCTKFGVTKGKGRNKSKETYYYSKKARQTAKTCSVAASIKSSIPHKYYKYRP